VASATGCALTIFSRRVLDAMAVRTAAVADLGGPLPITLEISRVLYGSIDSSCTHVPSTPHAPASSGRR
jgi:hypothetical protein